MDNAIRNRKEVDRIMLEHQLSSIENRQRALPTPEQHIEGMRHSQQIQKELNKRL